MKMFRRMMVDWRWGKRPLPLQFLMLWYNQRPFFNDYQVQFELEGRTLNIKKSGRTKESRAAFQGFANFLEKFGEVVEEEENIFIIDGREKVLVAYSSQSYYGRKGYYWFSLAKTKYAKMIKWNEPHSWMVLICGGHGQYFIPFSKIKPLLARMPSNRRDGRWDLYIRLENERAYFGVTKIRNHLDVTEKLHYFEQIWEKPAIEEEYQSEAIYIPDSLPEPDRRTGNALRVIRDTSQSKLVKELYEYCCQICGKTIQAPHLRSLKYCEAHHVQPLGRKYKGPDHSSNIVALCPNHHSMMDLGVIAVEPTTMQILAIDEEESNKDHHLNLLRKHGLNSKYLQFHLNKIYVGNDGIEFQEIQLTSGHGF